jgi:hypothetical protein
MVENSPAAEGQPKPEAVLLACRDEWVATRFPQAGRAGSECYGFPLLPMLHWIVALRYAIRVRNEYIAGLQRATVCFIYRVSKNAYRRPFSPGAPLGLSSYGLTFSEEAAHHRTPLFDPAEDG